MQKACEKVRRSVFRCSELQKSELRAKPLLIAHKPTDLLGGPFDLVSRVSKVGYGDYKRVSRGY